MLVPVHCALLFSLTCFIYWESTVLEFAFDDHLAIVNNPDVTEDRFKNIWVDDFWGRPMHAENSHTSWRPLTILSFRLEYIAYDGLNGGKFHTTNVLLHAFATVLVYLLALHEKPKREPNEAFLCGLIFAVHPVHVEAVTGVVGRAEVLCAIFLLISHICLRRGQFLLCILGFIIALLTKEIAITYTGICIAQIFSLWIVQWQKKSNHSDQFCTFFSGICFMFAMCSLSILYFVSRAWLCSRDGSLDSIGLGDSELIRKTENPYRFVEFGLNKFLSLQIILMKYAELLIFPTWLCSEYSYACIPMVDDISDSRLVAVVMMHIVFWFLVLFSLRKLVKYGDEGFAMALVWTGVPFIPSSHIFVTIGTLVAERLLYVPSIGFSLLVGRLWNYLGSKSMRIQKVAEVLIVVVIAWYAHLTTARIPDWLDDATLFESAVKNCPNSAKINLQYHTLLLQKGNSTGAEYHLNRAKEIHPDWCDLDIHIGSRLWAKEDMNGAIEKFIESLRCKFTNTKALQHLQDIFSLRQQLETRNNVTDPLLHYDMGRTYETVENFKQASEEYRKAYYAALEFKDAVFGMKVTDRYFAMLKKCPHDILIDLGQHICEMKLFHAQFAKSLERYDEALKSFLDVIKACEQLRPGAVSGVVSIRQQELSVNGESLTTVRNFADSLALVTLLSDSDSLDNTHLEYMVAARQYYIRCTQMAMLDNDAEALEYCREKLDSLSKYK